MENMSARAQSTNSTQTHHCDIQILLVVVQDVAGFVEKRKPEFVIAFWGLSHLEAPLQGTLGSSGTKTTATPAWAH